MSLSSFQTRVLKEFTSVSVSSLQQTPSSLSSTQNETTKSSYHHDNITVAMPVIIHQSSLDTLNQSKQHPGIAQSKHPPEIHHPSGLVFIHPSELRQRDYFSDSWLINRQRFLEIDVTRIGIVEDAAFAAVGDRSWKTHSYSKMTYDWTDFCVEHLSKWWGVLQILRGGDPGQVFNHTIGMLERYIKERVHPPVHPTPSDSQNFTNSSPLQNTIAMIAFAPYKARTKHHDPDGTKGQKLTSVSLAATIASLYQAGFGRVVVVGINNNDIQYVVDAVDVVCSNYDGEKLSDTKGTHANQNLLARLGRTRMEIAFVHVSDPEWISNGKVDRNIPRAAVIGMRLAMSRKLSNRETTKWLGTHKNPWQHWENVYLTEPDTLLHFRPELLPNAATALREGLSLFPHRLHPLPHEDDLPSRHRLNPGIYLPNVGHFANITTIAESDGTDEEYVACCDDGGVWPGDDGWEKSDGCGPWWTCGFHRIRFDRGEIYDQKELLQKHQRLQLYPMMVSDTHKGGVEVCGNRLFFANNSHAIEFLPTIAPSKRLWGCFCLD
jgi:hypothetical protein